MFRNCWVALYLLTLVMVVQVAGSTSAIANETTIILVRHAEKATGDGDVPLTDAGQERAQELAKIASILNVTKVYCTNTLRSKQTAQPTAESVPLETYTPTAEFIGKLKTDHDKQAVLIVAHSNTIPTIFSLLGDSSNVEIAENDFGKLFIVKVTDTKTTVAKLRYGKGVEIHQ